MNERETVEIEEDIKIVVTSSSDDDGNNDSDRHCHGWGDPGYYRDAEAVEAQARAEEDRVRNYSCYVESHNASYLAVQREAERLEAETIAYQERLMRAYEEGDGDTGARGAEEEARREEEDARREEEDVRRFEKEVEAYSRRVEEEARREAEEQEKRVKAEEEAVEAEARREARVEEERVKAEEEAAVREAVREEKAAREAAEAASSVRKAELSPRGGTPKGAAKPKAKKKS